MSQESPKIIWETALDSLRVQVSTSAYDTWLKSSRGVDFDGETFVIQVENSFIAEWLDKRMRSLLERTLAGMLNRTIMVSVRVISSVTENPEPNEVFKKASLSKNPTSNSFSANQQPAAYFTFDHFARAQNSELARAAAVEISERPGQTYNPLLFSGPSGIGKTHLLNAVANQAKSNGKEVLLTTGEDFVNDFVEAARHKAIKEFRDAHRSPDLYILDDIHFICGKEKSEENLFYTFNSLLRFGKQVVISSNAPLQQLPFTHTKLMSSLSSGLTVTLDPLDKSSRVSILAFKATRLPIQLGDDVLHYIASRPYANVHQMEGDLNKLVALSTLLKRKPDLPLATQALTTDITSANELGPMSGGSIIDAVAAYHHVGSDAIIGKSRVRSIVLARYIAMYLIRQHTNLSLSEIGLLFSKRDHSSVIHGVKKIESLLSTNTDVDSTLDAILNIISTKNTI